MSNLTNTILHQYSQLSDLDSVCGKSYHLVNVIRSVWPKAVTSSVAFCVYSFDFLITKHPRPKTVERGRNIIPKAMMIFDFEIIYQKGSKMPANFLSQNVVDLIKVDLIVDLEKYEMDQNRDQEDWIKGISCSTTHQ
jgi:hypothetical protein